ncbi:hypothetical protein QVD17_20303 [Tagetes erecta]|uniref:Uncharacterized protein n=1 Tax=Tagetes erecta TaxID=13708 RepID=A0AAD8KPP5_TARER|nr:hypothetical protein QVD17_20303 [Tagetes erecta]
MYIFTSFSIIAVIFTAFNVLCWAHKIHIITEIVDLPCTRELSRCPDALKFFTIVSPHAPLLSLHDRNCRHGYDNIYDCTAESRTQDK